MIVSKERDRLCRTISEILNNWAGIFAILRIEKKVFVSANSSASTDALLRLLDRNTENDIVFPEYASGTGQKSQLVFINLS